MSLLGDIFNAGKSLITKFAPAVIQDIANPIPIPVNTGVVAAQTVFSSVNAALPEGELANMVAKLEGLNAKAPGTNASLDFSRIIAFASVEAAIGLAEELSPSAAFIMGSLFGKMAEVVLAPNWRDIEYMSNYANPNKVLDIHEVVTAMFRGVLPELEALGELQKEGYNSDQYNRLVEVSREYLNLGELINLRFRGVYKDDTEYENAALKLGYHLDAIKKAKAGAQRLIDIAPSINMYHRGIVPHGHKDSFDDLRAAGYTEERIDAIKSSSVTLPNIFNIQDFAVRQVDNEEIVQKFQLDARIDESYFEGATKLGYDRDTARRFYRYYWEYPPFFILERMYTQGKIPEQDFRDVLGFLRFTPYWIDKFSELLKPTLTEGEITDQFKYQLIKEADVAPALVKLNLPPALAAEKAKLIIAKTKLATPQNQNGAQTKAAKIKDVTLGLIKDAYKDGVITKAEAEAHLIKIEYTKEAADLELSIADYELHKENLAIVIAEAKADVQIGAITIPDALTMLSQAGATATQIDRYQAEFTKLTTRKPVQPTKAELKAWFKAGIISAADYASGLSNDGVQDQYIGFYLEEAGVAPAQISTILGL